MLVNFKSRLRTGGRRRRNSWKWLGKKFMEINRNDGK